MSTIVAGHFQLQNELSAAREQLIGAGFPEDQICGFFLNQPGQHDMTPYGGDHAQSPGAREAPLGVLEGAAAGGALGVAAGVASGLVAGPLGPLVGGLVGAHVGSLYSLHKMKEAGEPEAGESELDEPRQAGVVLAVALADPSQEARALGVLRELGAHHLERAEGVIVGGDWVDFDPLSTPHLIH
jgi:hypothetical protein